MGGEFLFFWDFKKILQVVEHITSACNLGLLPSFIFSKK